jgi:hypothetical protein
MPRERFYMKRYWKIIFVSLMFAGQTYMVYQQGKTFSKLMEIERGYVEQRLSDEGLPRQQVLTFSSLLIGIESNVRYHVNGVSLFLITTNFLIFIVLLIERRKARDGAGEA